MSVLMGIRLRAIEISLGTSPPAGVMILGVCLTSSMLSVFSSTYLVTMINVTLNILYSKMASKLLCK